MRTATTAAPNNVLLDLGTLVVGRTEKAAITFAANDAAGVLNGGTVQTDGAITIPTVTTLHVGSRNFGAEIYNGYIRKLMYLPRRMSNADMQTLTT